MTDGVRAQARGSSLISRLECSDRGTVNDHRVHEEIVLRLPQSGDSALLLLPRKSPSHASILLYRPVPLQPNAVAYVDVIRLMTNQHIERPR
jgi:hypothetical protein